MVQIRKHLVPDHIANKYIYGNKNTKKYIVIHETDNTGKGANADAHSRLQYRGNDRQASWHYQVDDKEVVQSFVDDAQCWHAGNEYYNKNGIGIEICVNSDGNFGKALDNTVELVKSLMKKHNISKANVIQHNKASGKNCPRNLRSGNKGVTWAQFVAKLDDKPATNTNVSKPNKKPTTPPKPSKNNVKLAVDGYWGPETTRALQRYFGTPVDGYLSKPSLLIKAMQKWLGTKQDGYISEPYSLMVVALQKRFGTPQDGKISKPSLMVKEMQRRLNNGKL